MTTTALPISTPTTSAPKPPSPRFTLELEFVLSLSNPYYLSHLALTYPHLLNHNSSSASNPTSNSEPEPESDASKFASYLSYLYSYWRKPEYARFLTHPGATLRNLELLQQEQFRRDIIRPDVIEKLLAAGTGAETEQEGEGVKDGQQATGTGEQEAGVKEEKEKEEKEEGENVEGAQQGQAMDVGAG